MSDPENGTEGEDTVSSIRRLVQDKTDTRAGRLVLGPAFRTSGPKTPVDGSQVVRLHPDWAVEPPGATAPWRIPTAMRRPAAEPADLDAKVAALEDLVARRQDAFEPDGAGSVGTARSGFGTAPWVDNADVPPSEDAPAVDMTEDELRDLVRTVVQSELRAALSDGEGMLAQLVSDAIDAALKDRQR